MGNDTRPAANSGESLVSFRLVFRGRADYEEDQDHMWNRLTIGGREITDVGWLVHGANIRVTIETVDGDG